MEWNAKADRSICHHRPNTGKPINKAFILCLPGCLVQNYPIWDIGIEIPMAAMAMGHLESASPAEFLLGGWLPCDWGNVADVACSTQILGEHRHGQTVTNLFGSYCSLKRFATFKDFKPWKPCPTAPRSSGQNCRKGRKDSASVAPNAHCSSPPQSWT